MVSDIDSIVSIQAVYVALIIKPEPSGISITDMKPRTN